MTSKFETVARRLLARMALPQGSVTVRQTRSGDTLKIIANIESGVRPAETPSEIDGYSIIYQRRRVLRISEG